MPTPGDRRSMDKQADDDMVGECNPKFGDRPNDDVVEGSGRKDKCPSEMVVAGKNLDVQVPK